MKSGTYFHFKQFSVQHDRCAMKVGTDAVLLGAWSDVSEAQTILDVGTGSGVIALMLAQRSAASKIEAVEIDRDAAEQANDNVQRSPWSSRIVVHHSAIQDFFPPSHFDLIVTNPPYFNRSLEPPDKKRHAVRHTSTLSYDQLLASVKRLLAPHGRFCLILPFHEGTVFTELATQEMLTCSRRYHFKSRMEKPVERTLLEFTRHPGKLDEGELLLYEEGQQWSLKYREMTRDFYLER